MSEKTEKDIAKYLTELVRLNRECLEITRRLLDAAPWPEVDPLTQGLEERGRLLRRIQEIEQVLPTRKEQDRVVLVGVADDRKTAVNESLAVLNRLAVDLVEADRLLRSEVQRVSAEMGKDVKKLNQGHAVLKAYSAYKAPQNYLIDKKG